MRNPPGQGEGFSRRPPERGNAEPRAEGRLGAGHMEKLGRAVQKGNSLCGHSEASQLGHTTSFQIFEGVGVQERGAGARGNGRQERGGVGEEENCSDLRHWRLGC